MSRLWSVTHDTVRCDSTRFVSLPPLIQSIACVSRDPALSLTVAQEIRFYQYKCRPLLTQPEMTVLLFDNITSLSPSCTFDKSTHINHFMQSFVGAYLLFLALLANNTLTALRMMRALLDTSRDRIVVKTAAQRSLQYALMALPIVAYVCFPTALSGSVPFFNVSGARFYPALSSAYTQNLNTVSIVVLVAAMIALVASVRAQRRKPQMILNDLLHSSLIMFSYVIVFVCELLAVIANRWHHGWR